jgi:hypothetical protein
VRSAVAIAGYLPVQSSPVPGQQPDITAIEPGMHAEAVVFDFMQPLVAVRRCLHEQRQLRPYPVRQSTRARV